MDSWRDLITDAICIGMFLLEKAQDTLIGAVMGMASMAGIFYFKKPEDE